MCNTVGALLSKQLTIQVFTGALMAAMDLLQFLLILYPMGALRSNFKSKSSSLLKKRKTKPRTSTFAVLFPLIAGTGYFYWASAALHSSAEFRGPRRQLLGNFLQNNTEIIGYALGIAAIIICWTSRIPLVSRAYKGRMFPGIMLWSHAFSVLASVLYAAAIVGHDKQLDFIIQTMPWLLLFLGSAALDTAILLLSCLMKCKFTQQLGLTAVVTTSDMEVLLQQVEPDTEDEKEDDDERQEKMQTESVKKKKLSWMPLNIVSKATSLQNCGSVGCYVGMIIEPVQEWQSDGEKKHWNLHTELQNEQETAWCSVQPNDSCVLTTSSEVIEHV
ncbi:transmembrane protein 44 [Protopterus annectens]|uniref:transmembrane protein 44 n=1 Tax=Protopterus annectens TaxID=7888 RepID=UPI001CFBA51C|nr:transmembrane protein 44 [Protopterus annectens]